MKTAFRQTATLPDRTGRYRTSIVLASCANGEWSEAARAEHCERNGRVNPIVALSITDEEYAAMQADKSLRLGYVDAPGDVTTPFTPEDWTMMV